MSQELDGRPCSKIGAADADHQKDFGVLADLRRRFLDAVKLFFVIVNREIDPSQEIISRSRLRHELVLRLRCELAHILHLMLLNETACL